MFNSRGRGMLSDGDRAAESPLRSGIGRGRGMIGAHSGGDIRWPGDDGGKPANGDRSEKGGRIPGFTALDVIRQRNQQMSEEKVFNAVNSVQANNNGDITTIAQSAAGSPDIAEGIWSHQKAAEFKSGGKEIVGGLGSSFGVKGGDEISADARRLGAVACGGYAISSGFGTNDAAASIRFRSDCGKNEPMCGGVVSDTGKSIHCECCSGRQPPQMIHHGTQTEPLSDQISTKLISTKHDPLNHNDPIEMKRKCSNNNDLDGFCSIFDKSDAIDNVIADEGNEGQLKLGSMKNASVTDLERLATNSQDDLDLNGDRLIDRISTANMSTPSQLKVQTTLINANKSLGSIAPSSNLQMNDFGNVGSDADSSLGNETDKRYSQLNIGKTYSATSIDMMPPIGALTIAGPSSKQATASMLTRRMRSIMPTTELPKPSWRLVEEVDPTLIDSSSMHFEDDEDDEEEDISDAAYASRHAPLELAERQEWERACGYTYAPMSLRSGDCQTPSADEKQNKKANLTSNKQWESSGQCSDKRGTLLRSATGAVRGKEIEKASKSGYAKRNPKENKEETGLPKIESVGKSLFREQRRLNFEAEIYRNYQSDGLQGGSGGSSTAAQHPVRKTRNSMSADYMLLPDGPQISARAVGSGGGGGQVPGAGTASGSKKQRFSSQHDRKRLISGSRGSVIANKHKHLRGQTTSSAGEEVTVAAVATSSSSVNQYRPRTFPLTDATYHRMLSENPPGHPPYPPSPPPPITTESVVVRRTQSSAALLATTSDRAECSQAKAVAASSSNNQAAIDRVASTQATVTAGTTPLSLRSPRTPTRNRSTTAKNEHAASKSGRDHAEE